MAAVAAGAIGACAWRWRSLAFVSLGLLCSPAFVLAGFVFGTLLFRHKRRDHIPKPIVLDMGCVCVAVILRYGTMERGWLLVGG